MENTRIGLTWQLLLRMVVGLYWLYFASQRWFNPFWVKDTLITAAQGNYVLVYGEFLRAIVAPNWQVTTVVITILESAVGVMILLGLFTRIAAAIGALNSINLTLTFSFCSCPWTEADFPLTFWFYFAPLLLNAQVVFDRSAETFGLDGLIKRWRATVT